jgi:hypothetical protein
VHLYFLPAAKQADELGVCGDLPHVSSSARSHLSCCLFDGLRSVNVSVTAAVTMEDSQRSPQGRLAQMLVVRKPFCACGWADVMTSEFKGKSNFEFSLPCRVAQIAAIRSSPRTWCTSGRTRSDVQAVVPYSTRLPARYSRCQQQGQLYVHSLLPCNFGRSCL